MRVSAAPLPRGASALAASVFALATAACAELASIDPWPAAGSGATAGASAAPGAGGFGGQGASGGVSSGTGACSTLLALHDDFTVDRQIWTFYESTAGYLPELVFARGEAQIPLPEGGGGDGFLQTKRGFYLRDSSITVRFSVAAAVEGTTHAAVALYDVNTPPTSPSFAEIVRYQGTLTARLKDSTMLHTLGASADVGYEYLHIRESGGTISFGASHGSAAVVWFGDAETPRDGTLELVHARLGARKDNGDPSGGHVTFLDVNVPALAPEAGWCDASTLQDDFNDARTHFVWNAFETKASCLLEESAGHLVISPGDEGTSCGYQSWPGYELGSAGAWVSSDLTGIDPSSYAWMQLERDDDNVLAIGFDQQSMLAVMEVDGMEVLRTGEPYSADDHVFWKIQTEGDRIFWRTSSDGVVWNDLADQLASEFPLLTDLQVLLVAGNDAAVPAGIVRYDSINKKQGN